MPAHGPGRFCPAPEDYRVGWISAIQIEHTIARELLDEEYDAPGLPSHRNSHRDDRRVYSCGRIGVHYVVIACLPKGMQGNVAATSLAKDLLRDFPEIDIRLMVGIGGGAPSKKHDIRLGDVVVSVPSGSYSGVVQYEFGKEGQLFEQTGSLNKPPLFLLSAVQDLHSRHEGRRAHRINLTIERAVADNHNLKKRYRRPPVELDVLYQSNFWHTDPSQPCSESCPSSAIVQRQIRDVNEQNPAIHYGLIASADKVMKNAIRRDELAQSQDILCFDMEAAGLMDDFRCLVIRGISDYSDSHKNDDWQGYAAATAAAYATELLSIISSTHRRVSTSYIDTYNNGGESSNQALPVNTDSLDASSIDLSSLDPPWLNEQSRQTTCFETSRIPSRQITFQPTPDLSRSSISYRVEDTNNKLWMKCQCSKDCALEWEFTDDPGKYQVTSKNAKPSSCLLKKYIDNLARTPAQRFLHNPSIGIRGKPLWTSMRQAWQQLYEREL